MYDIYIVEHVEAMKRENESLKKLLRETVHENALLCQSLNRRERAEAFWGVEGPVSCRDE